MSQTKPFGLPQVEGVLTIDHSSGAKMLSEEPISVTSSFLAEDSLPGSSDWLEGVGCLQSRDWNGASAAFRRAVRASPQDALYWLNLGHAWRNSGRVGRAVVAAKRSAHQRPDFALGWRLLGECLLQLHRYSGAVDAFSRAGAIEPADPDILLQHAKALMSLLRPREAVPLILSALAAKPGNAGAHAMLANALCDQGLKGEALECLKTAVALRPDFLQARAHLCHEMRQVFDWRELNEELESLIRLLSEESTAVARQCSAFALLSIPLDESILMNATRGEALAYGLGCRPLPTVSALDRQGTGRIRLGCLSFDFRDHPVSQLLVEMFESLDRSRFDLYLYSIGPADQSPVRRRMVAAATSFVELVGLSDEQAAQRMRADGIDIAIDLMTYTRGGRPGILAHCPAPLQLGYLGYPGTSAAPWIDYLIGDPLVTPIQLRHLYGEKLAQMPLCFLPNGRWRPLPQQMTRAEAGLPENAFVLCAFNAPYKILPQTLDVWCSVMRSVPESVLWMRNVAEASKANLARETVARGVNPERVLYANRVSYGNHFSRLALADVFVDTWPYNAHTSAADALWAGVPVVTVYGNSFASRVAASALNAVGLPELAFTNADDYRWAIMALATDPDLCAGYRRHLVEQRMQLPLFDCPRYTREWEDLLTRLWTRWQSGQPPAHCLADGSWA